MDPRFPQQKQMDGRIGVCILGATGMVGQRFVQLLQTHPTMYVAAVAASERTAGQRYGDAVHWVLDSRIPKDVADMEVQRCDPSLISCTIVFSALSGPSTASIEQAFAEAGMAVFTNASAHRMDPLVPLLVPTANAHHLDLITHQRMQRKLGNGCIVANANCSVTGLAVALAPLQAAFGPIGRVAVTTMQAVSGAGYPGVASLDILGNVVPFIKDEEDKLEHEAPKILGSFDADNGMIVNAPELRLSATCNRVPVVDGHTACVMLEFVQRPPPSPEQVKLVLRKHICDAQTLGVHSAPSSPIIVMDDPARPQPRLDANACNGFAVVVGRVRECSLFDIKFTLLSHNTVLGAAGSSIMNAEIALAKGLVSGCAKKRDAVDDAGAGHAKRTK